MDLTRHVMNDLLDTCVLYERKLASMGVVQLKLSRGSQALRLTDPENSVLIGGLADIAADLETRQVSWIEGMAFVDRVRETAAQRALAWS